MNGISPLIAKIVAALAVLFLSYMVGQGMLSDRVTILETNYIHIKETMEHIHDKVERLLERE